VVSNNVLLAPCKLDCEIVFLNPGKMIDMNLNTALTIVLIEHRHHTLSL
jgi:hypothetical protein